MVMPEAPRGYRFGERDCPHCDGMGRRVVAASDGTRHEVRCSACFGTGRELVKERED